MDGAATGYDVRGAAVTAGLRHVARRLLGRSWDWLRDPRGELPFDAREMERWLRADDDANLGALRAAALAEAAVVAVSRVRPVYLWLDDVGWSRDGALDLVERLSARDDVDALVVMTTQAGTAVHPALRGSFNGIDHDTRATSLYVGPLNLAERRQLLDAVVSMAPGLANALAERLDGAPLMLLARVYSWLDNGLIVSSEDGHTLADGTSLEALFAESTGSAAIAERVEALITSFGVDAEAAERALLVAAMLGIVFEERVLVDAFEHAEGHGAMVAEILDRTLLSGLLRPEPGTEELRFDHGLVQQSLLARLEGHEERAVLVRATIDALSRAYEPTRAGVSERSADLYRELGDVEAAVDALLEVCHAQARRGEFDGALATLATARGWLDAADVPESSLPRGKVLLREAEARFFASDYAASAPILARAIDILEVLSAGELLATARNLESGLHFYQDRFADAERAATSVVTDRAASQAARHHAFHRLMQIRCLAGDHGEMTALNLRAMAAARQSGESWRTRCQHLSEVENALTRGRLGRAARHMRMAVASARRAGDQVTLAESANAALWFGYLQGRFDDVREIVEKRLPDAIAHGDTWRETLFRIYDVLLAIERDQADVSTRLEDLLRSFARAPHDDPGSRWSMWHASVRLVEVGRPEEAARLRAAFDARSRALEDGLGEPVWDPGSLHFEVR